MPKIVTNVKKKELMVKVGFRWWRRRRGRPMLNKGRSAVVRKRAVKMLGNGMGGKNGDKEKAVAMFGKGTRVEKRRRLKRSCWGGRMNKKWRGRGS